MYGSTNPRALADITRHSYWTKNAQRKEELASALSRPVSISGILANLRLFFNPRDRRLCLSIEGGAPVARSYSSAQIFASSRVLPYYISPADVKGLPNDYASKFKEALSHYSQTTRVPRIYRITDFTYCDDLGRIYYIDESSGLFEFKQYTLSRGSNFRNSFWFRGYRGDVEFSAYIGVGLAGMDPVIQTRVFNSLKYDIHHIDENLFDIRPSSLIPIPTWMHLRWVHASDRSKVQTGLFRHTGRYPWE